MYRVIYITYVHECTLKCTCICLMLPVKTGGTNAIQQKYCHSILLSPLLLFFLFLGTTTTHNFVVFPSCFLTLARTKIHRSTPTAFLQRCPFLAFGGPTIGACTFHLNQISPVGHVEHAALLHQFFLVLFSLSFHVGSKNFEVFFGPTVSVGNAKL